jgi:hypothetical protein
MRQWIRSHLTYANVMSTLAVFLVIGGGTALASYVVSSNSQVGPGTISGHRPPSGKHANIIAGSISGRDVANDSLGGADINEAKLFKVPRAARADSAASADNATHASTADTATNAQALGGHQASDFFLHCPGNLARAGDLCFEVGLRSAPYAAALKACARDQRRLPNAGELALVYDHLGAEQSQEWTASHFIENVFEVATLAQNSSRDLLPGASGISQPENFRCVTSATN